MAGRNGKRRPTPPGSILREHYLRPMGLSISALAERTGVSRKHLSDVVNGHVRVTPNLAVRLARALGTSAALWVELQAAVDAYDVERRLAEEAHDAVA